MPPREKSKFNVYVKNLATEVGDEELLQWFRPFGTIRQARVMINTDDGSSRGYGFVLFEGGEAAAAAITAMQGMEKHGLTLHVEAAEHDGEKAAAESNVVWVRNIPAAVGEDVLEDFLVRKGVSGLRTIKRTDMPKKPEAWMASIDFRSVDSARRAIDELHQKVVFDEQGTLQMLAKFGEPPKPTPTESAGRRSQRASPSHANFGRTPGKEFGDRRTGSTPHGAKPQGMVFPSAPSADIIFFQGKLRRLPDGNYAIVEGTVSAAPTGPHLGSPAHALSALAPQHQPTVSVAGQGALPAHSLGNTLPAGSLPNGVPPAPLFATQPTVPMMMLAASQNSVPGQLLMVPQPQAASMHQPGQSSIDT